MSEPNINIRISMAIPQGMFICTLHTFIVFVGYIGKDSIPDREFDLMHVSDKDEAIVSLINALDRRAA